MLGQIVLWFRIWIVITPSPENLFGSSTKQRFWSYMLYWSLCYHPRRVQLHRLADIESAGIKWGHPHRWHSTQFYGVLWSLLSQWINSWIESHFNRNLFGPPKISCLGEEQCPWQGVIITIHPHNGCAKQSGSSTWLNRRTHQGRIQGIGS